MSHVVLIACYLVTSFAGMPRQAAALAARAWLISACSTAASNTYATPRTVRQISMLWGLGLALKHCDDHAHAPASWLHTCKLAAHMQASCTHARPLTWAKAMGSTASSPEGDRALTLPVPLSDHVRTASQTAQHRTSVPEMQERKKATPTKGTWPLSELDTYAQAMHLTHDAMEESQHLG